MTTRKRIAITAASTLALGIAGAGQAWSVGGPGAGERIFGIGLLVAYGLAIVGVFLVDRRWALLSALGAVGGPILGQALNQNEVVYGHDPLVLPPWLWALLVVVAVLVNAAILAVGLLARVAWKEIRRRRSPAASTSWSGR